MIQNRLFGRSCSGHLEIILAIVIAMIGAIWFWRNASSKSHYQPASMYYAVPQQYTSSSMQASRMTFSSQEEAGKLNTTLLWVAGGLIYIVGVMTGLFFPLLHSLKHKHHKVPFSLSNFLPTKGNRAMGFLNDLQNMRDSGLISKQEFESKRLEFLAKL